jgi:hypothetical protein
VTDPFADVAALPEMADAVAGARAAVDRLLGHRVLRRRSAEVSAESALRGARASAALEGHAVALDDVRAGAVDDPVVQGALRVSAELGTLSEIWRQAPGQVLARLHALAALDVVEADRLGRPRTGERGSSPPDVHVGSAETVRGERAEPGGRLRAAGGGPEPDADPAGRSSRPGSRKPGPVGAVRTARERSEVGPAPGPGLRDSGRSALGSLALGSLDLGPPPVPTEVSARLDALFGLLTTRTEAPALVVGAIVHGELLALRPFGWGDGVVARAAQRVTFIERGLDPKSLVAPEVGHAELGDAYAAALRGYVSGTPAGMAQWVRHCADAVSAAARDSLAVCEALQRG